MADVFISYSRRDREFANRLVNALEKDKRDVWVDWQDIPRGEQWLNEIKSGIENADSFVFIVTQHSLTSEICNVEVEHALQQNKRIIPLVRQRIDDDAEKFIKGEWFGKKWQDIAAANWTVLGHINWVFGDNDDTFDEVFKSLIEAIETDYEHVKLHTRYQVRALDWQRASENPSFLLTGDEITAAEAWLEASADKDPVPSNLQQRFIINSRKTENERLAASQRMERQARTFRQASAGLGVVAVIAIIATVIAGISFNSANQRLNEVENTIVPATLDSVATDVQLAENEIRSLQLASRAQTIYNQGNPILGLSLALETSYIAIPPQTQLILAELAYQPGVHQQYQGHTSAASSVAFSPDGTQIISGSYDNTLILWDVESGNIIRQFIGHSSFVNSVAFSPDGAQIVSGSDDRVVSLWNVDTGEIIHRFVGHSSRVTSVAFSPDGSQIISGSYDKTLILWDVESGNIIRQFGEYQDNIYNVAFSPDGSKIAVGSYRAVVVHDVASGRILRNFDLIPSLSSAIAISPDGSQIATSSFDTITIWDLDSGDEIKRFEEPSLVLYTAIAFSPDGSQIATGSFDTITLRDLDSGDEITRLEGHSSTITSLDFSPDGSQIVSSSDDSTLLLWDIVSGNIMQNQMMHSSQISSVAFSPDGSQLVSGSYDNTIILLDVNSGNLLRHFIGHSNNVIDVAFSPDGSQILSASHDSSMILWDVNSGGLIRRFEEQSGIVLNGIFSPDGNMILARTCPQQNSFGGCLTTEVLLWNVESATVIRQFAGHDSIVTSVAFSPDGLYIASSSNVGDIIIWDTHSGNIIKRFEHLFDTVSNIAFSPDGLRIVYSNSQNTMILRDIHSGEVIRRFEGHFDVVRSIAFSPDGNTIISGSHDSTIILWDAHSGSILRRYEGHSGVIYDVAFSPDGSHIASASSDSSVILWRYDSVDQLQYWIMENRALIDFTCEQRLIFGLQLCNENDMTPLTPTLVATRTPLPIEVGSTFTPFASPTLTFTPSPTLTLTPTNTPILSDDIVQIGNNQSVITIGGGEQWMYEGSAGEILTIRVEANNPASIDDIGTRIPDGFDTYLIIQFPGGEILEFDDIEAGIITNSLAENLVLPEDGSYIIEVRSWDNRSGGAYTLIIERVETATSTPTASATRTATVTATESD